MNRWYTNSGLRLTAAGLDAVVAAKNLRSDEGDG
jgi:hypothetical protein